MQVWPSPGQVIETFSFRNDAVQSRSGFFGGGPGALRYLSECLGAHRRLILLRGLPLRHVDEAEARVSLQALVQLGGNVAVLLGEVVVRLLPGGHERLLLRGRHLEDVDQDDGRLRRRRRGRGGHGGQGRLSIDRSRGRTDRQMDARDD